MPQIRLTWLITHFGKLIIRVINYINNHIFAKKLGSSNICFYIDKIFASRFLSNSRFLSTLNLRMLPALMPLGRTINGTFSILCSLDNNIASPSSMRPTVKFTSNFFFLRVGIYAWTLSFALYRLSLSESSKSLESSSSTSSSNSSSWSSSSSSFSSSLSSISSKWS